MIGAWAAFALLVLFAAGSVCIIANAKRTALPPLTDEQIALTGDARQADALKIRDPHVDGGSAL